MARVRITEGEGYEGSTQSAPRPALIGLLVALPLAGAAIVLSTYLLMDAPGSATVAVRTVAAPPSLAKAPDEVPPSSMGKALPAQVGKQVAPSKQPVDLAYAAARSRLQTAMERQLLEERMAKSAPPPTEPVHSPAPLAMQWGPMSPTGLAGAKP